MSAFFQTESLLKCWIEIRLKERIVLLYWKKTSVPCGWILRLVISGHCMERRNRTVYQNLIVRESEEQVGSFEPAVGACAPPVGEHRGVAGPRRSSQSVAWSCAPPAQTPSVRNDAASRVVKCANHVYWGTKNGWFAWHEDLPNPVCGVLRGVGHGERQGQWVVHLFSYQKWSSTIGDLPVKQIG